MAKRKRYDDKFRASAVVMLEAAGYPGKLGALSSTAKHLGIPDRTLSRWYNAEQNPPPDKLVREIRASLSDDIRELFSSMGESIDLIGGNCFDWSAGVPKGKLDAKKRYVYLIRESWQNMVKIGIATDLYARVASMQAGCPQTLTVIGYFVTDRAKVFESHLHRRFSHKLYSGEWFNLSDDDIRLILDYHDGFVAVDEKWQTKQEVDIPTTLEQMRFC